MSVEGEREDRGKTIGAEGFSFLFFYKADSYSVGMWVLRELKEITVIVTFNK